MTPKQILQKAKALISKPENWTRHAYARNAKGRPVTIKSSTGCKFCMAGAIFKASNGEDHICSIRALSRQVNCFGIAAFNDDPTTTHRDVMRVYNKAIKSLS